MFPFAAAPILRPGVQQEARLARAVVERVGRPRIPFARFALWQLDGPGARRSRRRLALCAPPATAHSNRDD